MDDSLSDLAAEFDLECERITLSTARAVAILRRIGYPANEHASIIKGRIEAHPTAELVLKYSECANELPY